MSDDESDLASVTSSVAEEQTSVAFKAPVVTPAASSDMDVSPGADTMKKPCETAEIVDVKTEETVERNCADMANKHPRKPIVHVDEIWDKEKRRFMIFTPTDDAPMSEEQKNCILLVCHMHPRDIRHNVRTMVEVKRKGLRMLMRKIFLGATAFTWGDRNDLEPKWFFWARPRLVNLRKHCIEIGHEQILLEIEAALSFCHEHYETSWESIENLQKERRIRFRDVWTIFPPNTLVTGRDKLGHPRVWKVEDGWKVDYGEHKGKFQLDVQYAESDGKNFGWASDSIYIHPFSGARLLDHLAVQPLHSLANRKTLEKSLRHRATAQLKLHNERFTLRRYTGHGLVMDERPDGEIELKKRHFRGKIMIDPAKALEINPEHLMPPVYEFATSDFEHHHCNLDEPDGRDFVPGDLLLAYDNSYDEDDLGPKGSSLILGLSYEDEPIVMYAGPGRSHQPSRQQEEAILAQKPLSEFQRLLLSGLVYGYDLKFGNWAAFSVSLVDEFSWNDTAFDALVMETKLKTRLGSLIKAYGRKTEGTGFDDFIKEKGLGLIGLLFGKPGLGKTFTAEAIAEMARLPLMMVSAGGLGSQPDKIEKNLRDTLDVAARWRAVLLFDEADVFLAKRDATSIERNAVVSVFLRELEYFPGILLLTTNKKDLIDEAFQSRVHFCHAYPELDFQARVKIWKEFVMQTINHTALRVEINSKGYERLGRKEYNGREIKNIMSMATMSALDRTPPILTTDDILEISSTLQNWDALSSVERSIHVHQTQPPDAGGQTEGRAALLAFIFLNSSNMRLLNAATFEFADYDTIKNCKYAIVSHCWEDDEVNFQELHTSLGRAKKGWRKVEQACRLGKAQGYDWVWLDTCCIDRTSSAELSQAINSMFEWYRRAQECFVFLPDVASTEGDENFKRSRWFKRGWTLQELLAPASETFYNERFEHIGTKVTLSSAISEVTGIDARYLDRGRDMKDIYEASLAERMSWASKRFTKEPEDIAYCLLGIFRVNMPLLYGEGTTRAFLRLQLEMIKQSDDESIFAWPEDHENTEEYPGVLAQHPRAFDRCGRVMPLHTRRHSPHAFTSRGLELYVTSSWLESASDATKVNLTDTVDKVVQLDCEVYDPEPARLCIILRKSTLTGTWYRHGCKAYERASKWSYFSNQLSKIYVPQPELGQTGMRPAEHVYELDTMLGNTTLRWISEIAAILATLSILSQAHVLVELSHLPLIREAMQLIALAVWLIIWSFTEYHKSSLVKALAIGMIVTASCIVPRAHSTPVSDT